MINLWEWKTPPSSPCLGDLILGPPFNGLDRIDAHRSPAASAYRLSDRCTKASSPMETHDGPNVMFEDGKVTAAVAGYSLRRLAVGDWCNTTKFNIRTEHIQWTGGWHHPQG